MSLKSLVRELVHALWALPDLVIDGNKRTRQTVRDEVRKIGTLIMATQADVQALADQLTDVGGQLSSGVQELRDEITRLGDANPALDLGPIQDKLIPLTALADQLATDDFPAAPVEPTPEPTPDVPAEPAPVEPAPAEPAPVDVPEQA